jgi:sodium-dependent dicarboxylate transporter 2/3/5
MKAISQHEITIDRRPLWIVVCDRMRREIFLILLFVAFAFSLRQTGPADLSPEGYKTLCVFGLSLVLWASNLIPLSVTSLFVMAMIPLLGIMGASQVYSYFGNNAVFFVLGAFILSAGVVGCGLSVRLSLWVMDCWGDRPRRLIASIYLFGAVSSCVMSEHAVAAMLFPIVMEIARALKLEPGKSNFGKSLFFALAWGSIIGGSATALGGGRVPLAMELLGKTTHGASSITFTQYSQLSICLVLMLLLLGWVVLMFLYPSEVEDITPAKQYLHAKALASGRWSLSEAGVAVVMTVTVLMWFLRGEELGLANIAIFAMVALFVLNLITWKGVEEHVNWAIVLMYGGAICLGQVMVDSGAAYWLAKRVFLGAVASKTVFLMTIAVLSLIFTSFMSNSAVVAILVPPAISLADAYGISPAQAVMAVTIPSNFAFILPIATPASAIAYSSRYIPLADMVKSGAIMGGLGILCFLFSLMVYWPMLGFR